jgi:hypothetical protein
MRSKVAVRLVALAYVALTLAGCAAHPRHAIDPSDRSPQGGREAVVVVSQGEIRGAVTASTGGQAFGLVGALIDVGVNQHRANKAEAAITPLRNSLTSYNFDRKALSVTSASLPQLPWLNVRKVSFSKDVSDESLNGILDKSESPEVILVAYDYALTADFSGLQVGATVTIVPKAVPSGATPSARMKPANAVYSQNFNYIVPLANATEDLDQNSRLWAATEANAARLALDRGIAGVNTLILRSLQQSPGDLPKLEKGEHITAGGMKGRLVEKDDTGTLLVDPTGMWVYVAQGFTK